MTDADLLCEARRGSAAAWRTLYQRYLPAVWRQAYALVSDGHLAEDITSETMLAFVENIQCIDAETPKIAGWLRSVVRGKAANYHRAALRARIHANRAAEGRKGVFDSEPSKRLETAEARAHVLEVLQELPERQRMVLELKYLESMRVRDIAERLGESEKAVDTVLYRARREFRRLFERDEFCRAKVRTGRPPEADIPQES